MIYIVIVASVIFLPYLIWIVLFGCTLIKKLVEKEWQPKRGLVKAVAKWEGLSAEDRMEVERKSIKEKEEKSGWVGAPSAKEEVVAMNEKVFKEGLTHPEVLTPAKVPENIRPNV